MDITDATIKISLKRVLPQDTFTIKSPLPSPKATPPPPTSPNENTVSNQYT